MALFAKTEGLKRKSKKIAALTTLATLLSFSTGAATVTFEAKLTAKGTQQTGVQKRKYTGQFPYFDVRGGHFGGWPSRTETVTFCLPQEVRQNCTIDETRTHSTTTHWGSTYGQGGPGYGIYIDSINSPGGGQSASYVLNKNTGCLTSTVTVRAKRRQRGWYSGRHEIYVDCPIIENWTQTQTKGPFTLDSSEGYKLITSYTGPLGTPNAFPGTVKVNANNGYTAQLQQVSPNNADVIKGMFKTTPGQGTNGPRLFALYDANDIEALALEVSQGVQNLYNDIPLVAGRRAMARFYVRGTHSQGNIGAELRAYRDGVELADSPISAESNITVRSDNIDRTQLDHAFLFKLPLNWTAAGDIELKAMVNPAGVDTESDRDNNEWTEYLNFRVANNGINTIVDVPLHIHQDGDRDNQLIIYEANQPTFYPIMKHIKRFHPVADSIRVDCGFKPLKPAFHGWPFKREWDISKRDHWSKILNRIGWKRFWSGCGFTSSYWTGLIHPALNNSALGGIARRNKKPSATRMNPNNEDLTISGGETFAHEIGHNKGLLHVCEINDPKNQDTNYPYPNPCRMALGNAAFFDNGHDGYFMLDVYHDYWGFDEPAIIGSNVSGLVDFPWRNRALPMMSYASGDRWISPFSYCLLLNRSGISCDAQTITQRYLQPDEVKTLLAQFDAIWQGKQENHKHNHGATADSNGKLADSPTVDIPVVDTPLPENYRVPELKESANAYLLVSGVIDTLEQSVDDYTLMALDRAPNARAMSEAQATRARFAQQIAEDRGSLGSVVLLRQYDNHKTKKVLRTDMIHQIARSQLEDGEQYQDFLHLIERQPGAQYFELVYGNKVVQQTRASSSKPQVSFKRLPSTKLTNDSILSWTAADVDGDSLSFSLLYSGDNGRTWDLVDSQITETEYAINSDAGNRVGIDYFKGSTSGKFRLLAFDGFNTTTTDLDQVLSVPGSKPTVKIMQQDGLTIKFGQSLYLSGQASDLEDGPIPSMSSVNSQLRGLNAAIGASMIWHSSQDGNLGSGHELRVEGLSRGVHTITYRVTDSDGMTGQDSITINVGTLFLLDNLAPKARVIASSTLCTGLGNDCYSADRVNDNVLSTAAGGTKSWANEDTTLPQWVKLAWPKAQAISEVELYTTQGYPISDYQLQYFRNGQWVTIQSVVGNTNTKRVHKFPTIRASELRILGTRGSAREPNRLRINEIVVKGGLRPIPIDLK